jgi:hypothetical protein
MPIHNYEIFLQPSDGGFPLRVGSCNSLIQAQQRVMELKTSTPGENFAIFDLENSMFVQSFKKSASA